MRAANDYAEDRDLICRENRHGGLPPSRGEARGIVGRYLRRPSVRLTRRGLGRSHAGAGHVIERHGANGRSRKAP